MAEIPPWEKGFKKYPQPWAGKKKKLETADAAPVELRVVKGGHSGPPRDPDSKVTKRLKRRTEENLTLKMKVKRDVFITEFLRDWNGPMAAIRMGESADNAPKIARQYLREPYVAKRIWEVVDAMDEAELINRKRVLGGLIREANFQGIGASHGARVSAWGKLANILGMEQENINVKGEVEVRGGVMIVPVSSPADWERLAENSQKRLKEDVRK
jgi:hypothetical protein